MEADSIERGHHQTSEQNVSHNRFLSYPIRNAHIIQRLKSMIRISCAPNPTPSFPLWTLSPFGQPSHTLACAVTCSAVQPLFIRPRPEMPRSGRSLPPQRLHLSLPSRLFLLPYRYRHPYPCWSVNLPLRCQSLEPSNAHSCTRP